MSAAMPAVLALIVCKTIIAGPDDPNAAFTRAENRSWDYSNSTMHCRREVIELYDPDVDKGADPRPFTPLACQRTAMMLGPQWDADHKNGSYRFFRVACPTPIRSGPHENDPVIGWTIPDCGSVNGTRIECEKDSVI